MTGEKLLKFKPLAFLLPAVLVLAVVLGTLPFTKPVLQDIPARLEETVREVTKTVTPEETPEPETVQAVGDYTDGVYTGSARGYGGTIEVQVTVTGGQITDIQVTDHSGETASFYSRAEAVIDRIIANQTWEVDAVSGATYSSKGIMGAVQNALTGEEVKNAAPPRSKKTTSQDSFTEPAAYKDGVYTGSAQGYGGTVTVEVTIEGGVITNIRVLDHSGETRSYYNRAAAVVDRMLKAGSPNVDAVSGATFSSNGIINATKRALNKAAADGTEVIDPIDVLPPTEDDEPTEPTEPTEPKEDEPTEPAAMYKDGTYSASGWCEDDGTFRYELTVTVTVTDGKIASVNVTVGADESEFPEDNEVYLTRALNGRRGTPGVPGQIVTRQGTSGVDAVSTATYSSNTIKRLAERALNGAVVTAPPDADEPKETVS